MGIVVPFVRPAPAPKPVSWDQVKADGEEFCSYCLMIIQQVDSFCSGIRVHVHKNFPSAAITRARDALKERGYSTLFEEGGAHGYGSVTFQ